MELRARASEGDETGMMKKGKTEVWYSDKQEKTQPTLEIRLRRQAERAEP